jgi:TPP-dependent 2-oxoacid decarboxylase
MEAPYNTVPTWDYGALFQGFGPQFKTKYHLVKTPDDLDALLADEEFNAAGYAQVSFHASTPERFGFPNRKFRLWSSFSINTTLLKRLRL